MLMSTWAWAFDAEHGRRLYWGELPLNGRVAGHSAVLPTQASRCANCHARGTEPGPPARAGLAGSQPIGGSLSAQHLTQPVKRRGGPASVFDAQSLCRLVRTGVDPAHIVVASEMPRYDLSDADCQALWSYLSR
jgi:hypothetical protein